MKIEIGKRVIHKTLGSGVIEQYIDFDGTTARSEMLKSAGVCFIKLDDAPAGYSDVVSVDIESLIEE